MKDTETKYYVRCAMSVEGYWRVTDWTANIEDLSGIIENRKKNYRYVESVSYEAKKPPEFTLEPTKRKIKHA